MSYERAQAGTYEHEQYSALKSLRVQHDLILQEISIVLDRLDPQDATERAEIKALADEIKATAAARLAEVDVQIDEIAPGVKGG